MPAAEPSDYYLTEIEKRARADAERIFQQGFVGITRAFNLLGGHDHYQYGSDTRSEVEKVLAYLMRLLDAPIVVNPARYAAADPAFTQFKAKARRKPARTQSAAD